MKKAIGIAVGFLAYGAAVFAQDTSAAWSNAANEQPYMEVDPATGSARLALYESKDPEDKFIGYFSVPEVGAEENFVTCSGYKKKVTLSDVEKYEVNIECGVPPTVLAFLSPSEFWKAAMGAPVLGVDSKELGRIASVAVGERGQIEGYVISRVINNEIEYGALRVEKTGQWKRGSDIEFVAIYEESDVVKLDGWKGPMSYGSDTMVKSFFDKSDTSYDLGAALEEGKDSLIGNVPVLSGGM